VQAQTEHPQHPLERDGLPAIGRLREINLLDLQQGAPEPEKAPAVTVPTAPFRWQLLNGKAAHPCSCGSYKQRRVGAPDALYGRSFFFAPLIGEGMRYAAVN